MHLYPDGASFDLKAAISGKFGVPAANIFVGNGSDELIHLLRPHTLAPGDEMLMAIRGLPDTRLGPTWSRPRSR